MATTEACRYRGYDIVPRRQWSQWCVSVYPTRADLPILSRSTLRSLTPRREEAVKEARKRIDRVLSSSGRRRRLEIPLVLRLRRRGSGPARSAGAAFRPGKRTAARVIAGTIVCRHGYECDGWALPLEPRMEISLLALWLLGVIPYATIGASAQPGETVSSIQAGRGPFVVVDMPQVIDLSEPRQTPGLLSAIRTENSSGTRRRSASSGRSLTGLLAGAR